MGLCTPPMEKATADAARVRALLDPKVDDLKQPCNLVKEGSLDMTEKGKAQPGLYCFLFHNIFILTKEIKPQSKYKVLIVIKIRSSLKVFREETEDGGPEFVIDTGKRRFSFKSSESSAINEWATLLSECLDGEHNPDHIKPVFDEVDGERIWNVRASITEEQKAKLSEMREEVDKVDLDEATRQWADDACLCRFLRAREWNVAKAMEMSKTTTTWRMETKPDTIQLSEIDAAGSTGDLYISEGRDRKGRVIVYMRPGKSPDTPEIRAQYARHMAWIMENMYPERLGMGFILNPPLPFWVLWQVVGAFLDPVTKRKVQFIRKKKEMENLNEFVDPAQLEEMYGGRIAPFSADAWKAKYFPNQ